MSAIFVNEQAGISKSFSDSGFSSLSFHRRLPGYAPSPLRTSPAAAERLGVNRVLVKDESDRFGLPSFKILGASFAVYQEILYRSHKLAISRKSDNYLLDSDWRTLAGMIRLCREIIPRGFVTATDGNHGRGVARTAAWFGVAAEVYVPEGTAPARIEGIESEGAAVTVVAGDYDVAVEAAAARADEGMWLIQDTSWPGYERIPASIVQGYSTIMLELEEQIAALKRPAPGLVSVQIGVGSLAAAVTGHFRWGRIDEGWPAIVGVEPESAACAFESVIAEKIVKVPGPHRSAMAGLNCGTLSRNAWPVLRTGIDAFITVTDEHAFEAMRLLASDGIVSGESGSAGLAGLIALFDDEEMREKVLSRRTGQGTDVLIISTEGITDPVLYGQVVNPPRR